MATAAFQIFSTPSVPIEPPSGASSPMVVTESRSRGILTLFKRSGTNGRRGTAGTGRGTYPLAGYLRGTRGSRDLNWLRSAGNAQYSARGKDLGHG